MKVELANLIEPTIEQLGYELSDLELKLGGRDGIVRVFIDKPDGVELSDCEIVSPAIERAARRRGSAARALHAGGFVAGSRSKADETCSFPAVHWRGGTREIALSGLWTKEFSRDTTRRR